MAEKAENSHLRGLKTVANMERRQQEEADGVACSRADRTLGSYHLPGLRLGQSLQQHQQGQCQGNKVAQPCGREKGPALGER